MKSFEQLAQSAHQAYRKRCVESGPSFMNQLPTWDQLTAEAKKDWVAVAKQLWAEFAAIH